VYWSKCGQVYSENLSADFPNTAHSSSRDGPATAWLTSERPDNVIPVPENFYSVGSMSTLLLAIKSRLLKSQFCVLFNLFLLKIFDTLLCSTA
jgi:hypothetical protein